jgi:ABC-type glycerol-3-phosphate transport system permease component
VLKILLCLSALSMTLPAFAIPIDHKAVDEMVAMIFVSIVFGLLVLVTVVAIFYMYVKEKREKAAKLDALKNISARVGHFGE